MAEPRPSNMVEGATTGDLDEEVPLAAKSAEERKAAAAMSSMDSQAEDTGSSRDVDQAAIKKAMERLGGGSALANGTSGKQGEDKKVVKKAIKVDAADVNLLIEELELTKVKATDLLRNHDGDLGKALRAYVVAPVA